MTARMDRTEHHAPQLHRIAVVGLSTLHERIVAAAVSLLTERCALAFEWTEPAAATLLVLDGRSLVAQGMLLAYVSDETKACILVGGDGTFSHPRVKVVADLPLAVHAVVRIIKGCCDMKAAIDRSRGTNRDARTLVNR